MIFLLSLCFQCEIQPSSWLLHEHWNFLFSSYLVTLKLNSVFWHLLTLTSYIPNWFYGSGDSIAHVELLWPGLASPKIAIEILKVSEISWKMQSCNFFQTFHPPPWSSGIDAGLWIRRPGFESYQRNFFSEHFFTFLLASNYRHHSTLYCVQIWAKLAQKISQKWQKCDFWPSQQIEKWLDRFRE